MKRNKATIYDVYKYMNQGEWQVMKYTGTALIQSFTHLNTEFEVRLTKDNRTALICIDGIIFDRTPSVKVIENLIAQDDYWYLGLNWDGAPEQIAGEMQEKRRVLTERLTAKYYKVSAYEISRGYRVFITGATPIDKDKAERVANDLRMNKYFSDVQVEQSATK